MSNPKVIIHCALSAEAKMLVAALELSRLHSSSPAQIFGSADESVLLLVSGVGIINTTIACSWLAGERDCSGALWLNTGIAGHPSLEIGQLCWASSVTGPIDDKKYYPYPIAGLETIVDQCVPVVSSIKPREDYDSMDTMVDMEAWAVFSLATRLTTLEKIHSIKIISDNAETVMAQINREYVLELYSGKLQSMISIISLMLEWNAQESSDFTQDIRHIYERLLTVNRATVSQKHQIKNLLRRALALHIEPDTIVSLFTHKKTNAAISHLQKIVINRAFP